VDFHTTLRLRRWSSIATWGHLFFHFNPFLVKSEIFSIVNNFKKQVITKIFF
jgi:hypothetical protein